MSIHVRGLVHIYGNGAGAVTALQGLDLNVADGEICIVRGPNGSGKTTLIGILTRAIAPSAGEVRVSQSNGAQPRVAVVRQFDDLAPELTVKEHFELLGTPAGLASVPLHLHDRRVAALTQSERQQVAVALALSTHPDLLLADEPTGALAPGNAAEVYNLLEREVRGRHMTLLLVTHDAHAERIADRVVRLHDGRVSEEWTPGQAPRQVLDEHGWMRIPDEVRPGLARLLTTAGSTAGVTLTGRRTETQSTDLAAVPRKLLGEPVLIMAELTVAPAGRPLFAPLSHIVRRGSVTALTGPPGSGKSTLLRVLAGTIEQTSGTIRWHDGMTQLHAAYFSADQPFGTQLSLRELGVDEETLTALDLATLAERPLHTLSGGQRQRAIVAVALSHPYPFMLLDDPTTSLDDDNTSRVLAAILSSSKTMLIATHDPRVVAATDAQIALER